MLDRFELLRLLADGQFHSGQKLASQLGVSRGAVWKALKKMEQDFDLMLDSVRGRGYRLDAPIEFLDSAAIQAQLDVLSRSLLGALECHDSLDSTNRHLYRLAAAGAASGNVVMAEHQLAGRGRRGREWLSPFARNLYLSLLWRFELPLAQLAGLSLAVAVGVARALHRAAGIEPELKWPNDILFSGRKLGGILLEVQGEAGGPCAVVIGIGINVHMPATAAEAIDQPWTDLFEAAGRRVSRNALCAAILNELVAVLLAFGKSGLKTLLPDWRRRDAVAGREVRLLFTDHAISGRARGVDEQGALLLETDQGLSRYQSGEISLRLQEGISGGQNDRPV